MQTSTQVARETRFRDGVGAFIRRDFDALEHGMRRDVVMRFPGTSWLAGTYLGPSQVGRCIVGLRQVLESSEDHATFTHEDNLMIVSHQVKLHGPQHDVDMSFSIAISYDADDRVMSISVEPEDLALFDHVLKTALVALDRDTNR
jgi:hypothetical protein